MNMHLDGVVEMVINIAQWLYSLAVFNITMLTGDCLRGLVEMVRVLLQWLYSR